MEVGRIVREESPELEGFGVDEVPLKRNLVEKAGLLEESLIQTSPQVDSRGLEEMGQEQLLARKEVEIPQQKEQNKIDRSEPKESGGNKQDSPTEVKKAKLEQAAADYNAGKFDNLRQAATAYNVKYSTLYNGVVNRFSEFRGSGQFTSRLSHEEENKIVQHVKWRASVGYGVDWIMLQLLIQEVLLAVKAINPERVTGLEDKGQLPHMSYVRRFAERHRLVPRTTMTISKGRQVVSPEEMRLWQADAWKFFSAKPELMAALQDKNRVWNTDETSIELGVSSKRILAEKGIKVLYNVSSSTRDHITLVLTVSSSSLMAPPRVFFKGVRNVAASHLSALPKDGKSGAWGLTSTPKGFVTSETFLLILQDLVDFLEKNKIPRPIILFMDGASVHISLAMAAFCLAYGIQPWLFKPNTTHLAQPLDLTVNKSLKDVLRRKVTEWQQANTTSLSKYTVVPLVKASVDEMLTERPEVIENGFRRAGLVPWDPLAIDQRKMMPSSVFASPSSAGEDLEASTQKEPSVEVLEEPVSGQEDMPEAPRIQSKEKEPKVASHSGRNGKEPEMPIFSPRNLATFEGVFLSEAQIEMFEEMFVSGAKSSNPHYLAWKAFKAATLPSEAEAVNTVLQSHTPQNIPKRKKHSGRKVPDGAGRFDPTSSEWQAIMEETSAKKAKSSGDDQANTISSGHPRKTATKHKATGSTRKKKNGGT